MSGFIECPDCGGATTVEDRCPDCDREIGTGD